MSDLNLYTTPRKTKVAPKPRQRRDGPLQAELIPLLLTHIPGCQTHGWREATAKAFAGLSDVVGVEDDFLDALKSLELIPDAYAIHPESAELHFFEVEISHLMTGAKLKEYARFVTVMDCYGVKFEVYSVNQHGHINEVLLLPHYIAWLKEASAS